VAKLDDIGARIAKIVAGAEDGMASDISQRINKNIERILTKYTSQITLLPDGRIKPTVTNLRLVQKMQGELRAVVENELNINGARIYQSLQDDVSRELSEYFGLLEKDWTPKQMQMVLMKQAKSTALTSLISSSDSVTSQASRIVSSYITGGGLLIEMQDELSRFLFEEGQSRYLRHAKQIINDTFAGYVGAYVKTVSDDLGLEWFRYVGPLVKRSRPFCIHMVEKDYFHQSELPDIVNGIIDGKEVDKAGMNPETTEDNFIQLRGGYNCNHTVIPVPESVVPKDVLKAHKEKGEGEKSENYSGEYSAHGYTTIITHDNSFVPDTNFTERLKPNVDYVGQLEGVKSFEKDIANMPYEVGGMFDAKGRLVASFTGDKSAIYFPESLLDKGSFKGLIFTHNHPKYRISALSSENLEWAQKNVTSGFSFGDFATAQKMGVKEIRAISGSWVHVLRRSDGKDFFKSDNNFLQKMYNEWNKMVENKGRSGEYRPNMSTVDIDRLNMKFYADITRDFFNEYKRLYEYNVYKR